MKARTIYILLALNSHKKTPRNVPRILLIILIFNSKDSLFALQIPKTPRYRLTFDGLIGI